MVTRKLTHTLKGMPEEMCSLFFEISNFFGGQLEDRITHILERMTCPQKLEMCIYVVLTSKIIFSLFMHNTFLSGNKEKS